jgi:hypothetical protein
MPEPGNSTKSHIVVCPLCGEIFKVPLSSTKIPDHNRRDSPSISCGGSGSEIEKIT